jgi:hypothetical protein
MKTTNTQPNLFTEKEPLNFTPTQAQIDAFARRLLPEIKKYFADEEIQKEFAWWQEED